MFPRAVNRKYKTQNEYFLEVWKLEPSIFHNLGQVVSYQKMHKNIHFISHKKSNGLLYLGSLEESFAKSWLTMPMLGLRALLNSNLKKKLVNTYS